MLVALIQPISSIYHLLIYLYEFTVLFNQVQNLSDTLLSLFDFQTSLFHHTHQILVHSLVWVNHVLQFKQSQTYLIFDRFLTVFHLLNFCFNHVKILWVFFWCSQLVLRFSLFWRYDFFIFVLELGKVLRCVTFDVEFFIFCCLYLGHLLFEFDLFLWSLIVVNCFGVGLLQVGGLILVFFEEVFIYLNFVFILDQKREIWGHNEGIG